jgi:hypothetical protein
MPHAMQNILEIGASLSNGGNRDQNILVGIRTMREFIQERFNTLGIALRNIATNPLIDANDLPVPGTLWNGGTGLTDRETIAIHDVLGGYFQEIPNLDRLGIPLGILDGATQAAQLDALRNVITQVYDPHNDEINFALPVGIREADIRNMLKTKTYYGACPYVSFSLGYFYSELEACLYTKAGLMQMNGRVTPINNLFGMKNESFRKIVPFFAIGIGKNIDDRWTVSLELTHTLKTKKKLQDVNVLGHKISQDVSICKKGFRIMII